MEIMYLVTHYHHNAKTGGRDYKTDLATPSLAEAKKKYHALLGNYYDSDTFDYFMVEITDSFSNRIDGEYWQAEAQPEPEPTPEEITE